MHKVKHTFSSSVSPSEAQEEDIEELKRAQSLQFARGTEGLLFFPTINVLSPTKKTDVFSPSKKVDVVFAPMPPKITKHTNSITQLLVSPLNEHHVFTSSADHNLILWNTQTNKIVQTFIGHTAAVTCFCLYLDTSAIQTEDYHGAYLFSGDKNSQIRAWTVSDGKCIGTQSFVFGKPILQEDDQKSETFEHHQYLAQNWITSMAINIIGKKIYVGGYDGHVATISFRLNQGHIDMEKHISVEKHKRQITCINFDGKELYTGSSDGSIYIWHKDLCKKRLKVKQPVIALQSMIMSDKENTSFLFATLATEICYWKRDAEDEDDVDENDPISGITAHDTFPIDEVMFHRLKLDQITQKKFKPSKYMLHCGYDRRYSRFEFALIRDTPSMMSQTTRISLGRVKIEGTFVHSLTFSRLEGTHLIYYYVKNNTVQMLNFDLLSSPEFQFRHHNNISSPNLLSPKK